MPTNKTAEIETLLDQVQDVLDDAYSPESTREELAGAIGEALAMLEGEDEEEDDDQGEE